MIKNDAWPELWRRHLDQYLAKPPRTGFWMQAHFGRKANSFLELGCGSGRDALYLASRGHQVVGTDLDAETLGELNRRFGREGMSFEPADANALQFDDDTFDVVYHNGLWVLFDDDHFIGELLTEQTRVASRYAVILVHNAENEELVSRFRRRAQEDDLYDIRFFTRQELQGLVEQAGYSADRIQMLKFGGRWDLLYRAKRVKKVIPNVLWPVRQHAVPHLYSLEDWSRVERIACVIRL